MNNIPFIQGLQNIYIPSSINFQLNINSNINYSNIPIEILNKTTIINIASGITLTIDINTTLPSNIIEITGGGTLYINRGITLTLQANTTLSVSNVSGGGSLYIASNYNLSLNANSTFSISNIKGSGTLTINSGYTLTQGASISLSVNTIEIYGEWANAGYGITIPSNSTVNINISGSFTTGSTAGTLTVNGTLYWIQPNLLPTGAISSFPSFPLNLSGTGIMIAGYNFKSNATVKISFSTTSISAGTTDGSNSASGSGYEYYNLSQIKGTSTGKYCIGTYNGTNYYANALIYIGTANNIYNVSTSYYWSNYYDPSSGTRIYASNISGSAGTIYLTGYLMI